MTDFLLELLSEEIPARMQARAREDLERLFKAEIEAAGLRAAKIETFATPRRIALIAHGLPEETEAVSEDRRGPRADAPDQAIEGFLRGAGISRDQLEEREEKKGTFLYAVIETPGRATADVLAKAIPNIVRAFPWPKSMRWGAASASNESLRWVRPLQGIVAIVGEDLVECEIGDVASGYDTVGHRFHHPGPITIGGVHDYAEKLRACHVIIDQEEREAIIRERADALADQAGLARIQDTALVEENAGLTEWPVPLLGSFDEAYLGVPPEVIRLTMRKNQKYFACEREGELAPNFICVANIEAADSGAAIVAGNEKVLAARLADAKFFWEQDLKTPLADQAKKLDQIVFHEKLGTVADKVDRVAKLARWLVEEGIVGAEPLPFRGGAGVGDVPSSSETFAGSDRPHPNPSPEGEGQLSLADKSETAARLAKADLVTGMVGEFPELQGVIGGYYAAAQGLDPEIAEAIHDHYKPAGQGDAVPTAPVTVAVSLADKLDTLGCFFIIGQPPTGSKDPFALRRAALGAISLIAFNGLRLRIGELMSDYMLDITTPANVSHAPAVNDLKDFFIERLKVQQRSDGIRHDLIDAVESFAGRFEDDLVRLLARVHALQDFLKTADGANLLIGYKRAANILKKEGYKAPLPLAGGAGGGDIPTEADPPPAPPASGRRESLPYDPLPEENILLLALEKAERDADAAIAAEDFEGAMAALAQLRKPIDAFFDNVTVNDKDEIKRAARLGMLEKMRDAVHRVADFSKIEG